MLYGVVLAAGNECTLRAAIEEANANAPTRDRINFDVPTTGVATISPASSLPVITGPVIVDGYSQGGATENTLTQPGKTNAVLKIELDGTNAGGSTSGLVFGVGVSNSVVRGLAISAFGEDGIVFIGGMGHRVEGNFIGTDPTGLSAEGNDTSGVHLSGTDDAAIGGTSPAARNVISGNDFWGVWLEGGPSGNDIRGNLVGTGRNGGSLGNGDVGVNLSSSGNGNSILSNSIYANGALGIDLGGGTEDANDVTANDPRDPDAGPNGLQNFPVISSAVAASGGPTTIKGNLNSTPDRTFVLQFFSSPAPDPSGHGEGRTFVGEQEIRTNRNGNASFEFVPNKAVPISHRVTATATSGGSNTSEFSNARIVVRQTGR